jgi:hypothetical protein
MIYQLIENLSRRIMEWAIRKQNYHRHIIDEIADGIYYHALRTRRVKKAIF